MFTLGYLVFTTTNIIVKIDENKIVTFNIVLSSEEDFIDWGR